MRYSIIAFHFLHLLFFTLVMTWFGVVETTNCRYDEYLIKAQYIILRDFYNFQTIEALNSYTFGHVLYHLLFGQQLNSSSYEVLPEGCPSELGETQYLTWCGISDYKKINSFLPSIKWTYFCKCTFIKTPCPSSRGDNCIRNRNIFGVRFRRFCWCNNATSISPTSISWQENRETHLGFLGEIIL